MKKVFLYLASFFILLSLALFSGCIKKPSDMDGELKGSLSIVGSSSMQEVCDALAKGFMSKYPGIDVVKSGTGSAEAPRVVIDGVAQIGDLSRELTEDEHPDMFDEHIIAIDGIAICTNKNNNISNLTKEQISRIFTGDITDWSQLGGKTGAITVVGRDAASGTRTGFESIMKIEDRCKYSIELDSNGKVKEKIKSDPNAVGYISFSGIDSTVNVLDVDSVKATDDNILNGSYTVSRPFIQIVRKGTCDELINAWFDYVYSIQGENEIKSSKLIVAPKK